MALARLTADRNLIGGAWVGADDGGRIEVDNPADGSVVGSVPKSGRAETRRAIEAASAAFPGYSRLPAAERAHLLRRLHALIEDNSDELAALLTREQGKPIKEAKAEIALSAGYILWFAEEARRVYGDIVPSPWPERRIAVTHRPVGVVAAITPWNFPSSMLARKLGAALAAGCTVVAKPASATPFSGLAWGVLAEAAGFPPGVLNIVTGPAQEIGAELTENPQVAKISFTGSTETGRTLMQQAAGTVKKISLELGGNAPFLVFDDADLDRAVEAAMAAKYRNAGQTCVCVNRFIVQAGIHDAFAKKLAAASAALKVAPGDEGGSEIGPLIDEAAVEKVEGFVRDAAEQGGTIVTGGGGHARGGRFYQPTVITGAHPQMRLAREEIFGPVAPVFRVESEAEAIRLANDTEFGLAAYACTRDLGRAVRVSEALDYGLVGINEGIITTEVAPFGGMKQSGIGREGGRQGILDYLETKYVCVGGLGL